MSYTNHKLRSSYQANRVKLLKISGISARGKAMKLRIWLENSLDACAFEEAEGGGGGGGGGGGLMIEG